MPARRRLSEVLKQRGQKLREANAEIFEKMLRRHHDTWRPLTRGEEALVKKEAGNNVEKEKYLRIGFKRAKKVFGEKAADPYYQRQIIQQLTAEYELLKSEARLFRGADVKEALGHSTSPFALKQKETTKARETNAKKRKRGLKEDENAERRQEKAVTALEKEVRRMKKNAYFEHTETAIDMLREENPGMAVRNADLFYEILRGIMLGGKVEDIIYVQGAKGFKVDKMDVASVAHTATLLLTKLGRDETKKARYAAANKAIERTGFWGVYRETCRPIIKKYVDAHHVVGEDIIRRRVRALGERI